ncbi:hypothetical protein, partial [uncultured Planktomarina sp.]|uniref:hypothetical protein n=1 Tax=uncultured Planktomarina sp. TaxID=1538529 RepID=UPI0032611DD1
YVGAKAQCDGAYSVVVTSSETKHCLQISVIHHAYEVDLVPKAGIVSLHMHHVQTDANNNSILPVCSS